MDEDTGRKRRTSGEKLRHPHLGTDLFNSCCWWENTYLERVADHPLSLAKILLTTSVLRKTDVTCYMECIGMWWNDVKCYGIIWYDCSRNQNDTSTLVCSWREKSWQCYTMWISMIFRLQFHCWIMLNSRCRTSWSFHSEEWDRMGIWSSQWLLATCFSPLLHSWAAVVSWKSYPSLKLTSRN